MSGCRPDPSSKGSVSDSVGATDPFIVLSVTLSLLIVVFKIVELSMFELSTVDESNKGKTSIAFEDAAFDFDDI